MSAKLLAAYDRRRSYEWNYDHPPAPVEVEVAPVSGKWHFCGLPVDSPLGISAGPLLNSDWVLYYASLGFDVLTYKTVRSVERACYAMPNLQPVECSGLQGGETDLPASDTMHGTWAVSYGMPSKPPDHWRADVERTRRALPAGKRLSVSVVGTVQEGWTLDQLADDYALCATWAVASGADCVEMNFSCPNVSTCDGQLYQRPEDAARVALAVREAIGTTPVVAKIGRITEEPEAARLLDALAPSVDALAMTNSIAATVRDAAGNLLFDGQRRGICGAATREASVDQTRTVSQLARHHQYGLQLIGVGGVFSADHVRQYLDAGAHAVHLATAAMMNPAVGLEIRRELL